MEIQILRSLIDCPWDLESFGKEPFSSPLFHKLFEQAKTIGPQSGWIPAHFAAVEDDELMGILPAYIKTNSFGEFIFDWAWADFYQRNGLPYYPKLLAAVPFSPVNAKKIFAKNDQAKAALISAFSQFCSKHQEVSSSHMLFTSDEENKLLSKENFIIRKSIQYHLEVNFPSFEGYLQALKARKRKQVKKERRAVQESSVKIEIFENDFSQELMDQVHSLYLCTIDKKFSQAYLNKSFFNLLAKNWSDSLVIITAKMGQETVAMSLFLKSEKALYGRYWGAKPGINIPHLHFELSYYQGIEYCIKNKIPLFEAGAQGEQKILRGFTPVVISSGHKLALGPLHHAIDQHVAMENKQVEEEIDHLNQFLPYKKS